MEDQEKIELREHLIGWIDTLLKDGIVPQVVNPKAIRANYIRKSEIKEIMEEIEKINFNSYTSEYDDGNIAKYYILAKFRELMEDE